MAEDEVVTQALLEEFKARRDRQEDRPPCTRLFDDDGEVLGFARFAVECATDELTKPLREPSEGLRDLLDWLDLREGEYDVANEHEIGAPAEGRHGRAARLLRFFHAQWSQMKSEVEVLKKNGESAKTLAELDEAIAADPCLQLVVGPRVISGPEVAVKASWNRGRSSLSVRAATALAGIAAVLAGRDQENGGVS